MSLTGLLDRNAELRAYLRTTFPKPSAVRSAPIRVQRRGEVSSWVGTAFDYLLRWSLAARFPVFREQRTWIAEAVARMFEGRRTKLARTIQTRIVTARRRFERYRRSGELTDGLCRSAIELAQIDPLFRAGVGAEHILRPLPSVYAEELRELHAIVPWDQLRPERNGWLNPVFRASRLVAGADADLVVDDMLVDIKTSVDSRVYRDQFNQVLGYYLLHLLGGLKSAPRRHAIRRLAVYQSRQGRLLLWNVSDIAPRHVFVEAAVRFENIARYCFGWADDEAWDRARRSVTAQDQRLAGKHRDTTEIFS
jgi:hypothetical protein